MPLYVNEKPSGYVINYHYVGSGDRLPFKTNQQAESHNDTELLDWLVGHFTNEEREEFVEPGENNLTIGRTTLRNIHDMALALHKGDRQIRAEGVDIIFMNELFTQKTLPNLSFQNPGETFASRFEGDIQLDPIPIRKPSDHKQDATQIPESTESLVVIRQKLYRTINENKDVDVYVMTEPARAVIEYIFTRCTDDAITPLRINIYRPEDISVPRLSHFSSGLSVSIQPSSHPQLNGEFWVARHESPPSFGALLPTILLAAATAAYPYFYGAAYHLTGTSIYITEGLSSALSSLSTLQETLRSAVDMVPPKMPVILGAIAMGGGLAYHGGMAYQYKVRRDTQPIDFAKWLVTTVLTHNHPDVARPNTASPITASFSSSRGFHAVEAEVRTRRTPYAPIQQASHNQTAMIRFDHSGGGLRFRGNK
ncbi:hypothetical protein [Parendozoicomonas haliclonae]|uniref:hypothetical protein n=1 Tax=Parendozoicomonas haliclonae TaxID=1960125 RepID=UPI001054EDFB|nr:hypothetical protein [Parendozoicomonas haliclonae]